jgi:hypothetical protein
MHFLVIEQLPGTHKALGCDHNQANPEKDESEPVVTAKRPRQPFELQSTSRLKRVRICHREQKQVELLDDEPERYHGDGGADPGEKGSLVGSMITVAADYENLSGRPKRPAMKSVFIRQVARLGRLRKRASSLRVHGLLYQHVDRQKMGDHVSAVVPVMLVWLNGAVGILTGQQSVLAGFFWCQPVEFPTPPRMPLHRIKKMRFGPGLAAVSAHRDLRHLSLTCPCSPEPS